MIKELDTSKYQYKFLRLDVEGKAPDRSIGPPVDVVVIGHPPLYLRKAENVESKKKPGLRLFGFNWR
jgi:hypothetical protein